MCGYFRNFKKKSISDNKKTPSLIGNIETYVFTSILYETND